MLSINCCKLLQFFFYMYFRSLVSLYQVTVGFLAVFVIVPFLPLGHIVCNFGVCLLTLLLFILVLIQPL